MASANTAKKINITQINCINSSVRMIKSTQPAKQHFAYFWLNFRSSHESWKCLICLNTNHRTKKNQQCQVAFCLGKKKDCPSSAQGRVQNVYGAQGVAAEIFTRCARGSVQCEHFSRKVLCSIARSCSLLSEAGPGSNFVSSRAPGFRDKSSIEKRRRDCKCR